MKHLLILLFFICCLLNIYFLLNVIFNKPRIINRVHVFTEIKENQNSAKNEERKRIIKLSGLLSVFGNAIAKFNLMKKLKNKNQKELIKAGIPLKGEEFIAIQLIVGISFFIIAFKTLGTIIAGGLILMIGFYIPMIIVQLKKNKRMKLFNDQLGDTIVLISNSLKVGHSFLQAVDTASIEMPEPISKEFSKLVHEIRLGASFESAFDNLVQRVESDDLNLLITAVNIQRQTGGNLSEILDNISKTIRERIRIKGEIKTLTAQGKLSGIIVSILPIVIAAAIYMIDPQYLEPLYSTKIGLMLLCAAFFNEIIGYLIIHKIIKIDF